MKRQLLLVVAATALLIKFWPARDLPTPPGVTIGAITIRGLRLGMTRAEVIQRIGPPLQETESQAFRQFTEARYQKNSWEQDPQVTYSSGGRVIALVGKSLEWPGTSLSAVLAEKKLLELFPEAVELRQENYHPGASGMYFCQGRNLMLYIQCSKGADAFDLAGDRHSPGYPYHPGALEVLASHGDKPRLRAGD